LLPKTPKPLLVQFNILSRTISNINNHLVGESPPFKVSYFVGNLKGTSSAKVFTTLPTSKQHVKKPLTYSHQACCM